MMTVPRGRSGVAVWGVVACTEVVIVTARTVAADNMRSRFIRGLIRDVRPKPRMPWPRPRGPGSSQPGRPIHRARQHPREERLSTGRASIAAMNPVIAGNSPGSGTLYLHRYRARSVSSQVKTHV